MRASKRTTKSTTAASPEQRLRVLRIMWTVFLVNVGLLAAVASVAAPPAEAEGALAGGGAAQLPPALLLFSALGLASVALSFVLKGWTLRKAADERRPDLVQSGVIVALACCEAAALFGFVALFVTGSRYAYLLFALGAAGQLLHFPRREQLLAASDESFGDAGRGRFGQS